MSYSNGPRIVTDGLVLCLDAGNSKSYPGTGTNWYDLSGNNNHGQAYDCSLIDNGVNKYFHMPSNVASFVDIQSSSSINFTTSFTLFLWVYFNNELTNGYKALFGKPDPVLDAYGIIVEWTGGNMLQMDFMNTNIIRNGVNIYPSLTSWNFIAQTYYYTTNGSDNHKAYAFSNSGQLKSSATFLSSTVSVNNDSLFIKDPYGNGDDLDLFVGVAGAYNRALSENEIYQNYNALKGRFGLL